MNPAVKNFKNTFRSLKNRNYRLFFSGHGFSLIGTHMQRMALGWLVYELTGSALMLGIVAFSREAAVALLAPFAGIAADRWDRKRTLFISQMLLTAQAFTIAFLVYFEVITVRHIIILSVLHGVIAALEIPVRQSFVVDIVRKKSELANAIALNSTIFNGAMLIGPAVAGIVIAYYGEAVCFFINAFTYFAMLAALFMINVKPRAANKEKADVFGELKGGFIYAFDSVPIRYILILVGAVSLVALPYMMLLPIFAGDVLRGGPRALGFLTGSAGLGALTGAIFLASRKSVRGLGRVIAGSTLMLGIALAGFALSRDLRLSLVLIYFAGFGAMIQRSASNIILQTIVDDDKRGRIMSFYVVALVSMLAAGDLLTGSVAGVIGAPLMMFFGGLVCIGCSLGVFKKLPYIRKFVHPIYVRQGIMTKVKPELQ